MPIGHIKSGGKLALKFEWDYQKAHQNYKKHGISFEEASTVFGDPLSVTIADPLHSRNEQRFVIIGESLNKKVLIVAHTERDESIRIISARVATSKERKEYEER